ncbi:hypothetical protein TRVA0_052S00584 [Trichomonascus vanleenenianus]|uniref:Tvs1p n=1 Tax=Trichomonascus vanleenenianus TaxID=2268995 RepID=UPI003EC9DA18
MRIKTTLLPLAVLVAAIEAHVDEEVSHHMEHIAPPTPTSAVSSAVSSVAMSMPMASMTPDPRPMNGHHHHGMAILDDPNLEPQQRQYWLNYNTTTFLSAEAPNKFFLKSHIALTVIAWVFIFPCALVLSIERSPLHLLVQTLQSAVAVAALFCLAVYGSTAPGDLYPNNSYSKASVAMFFIVMAHWTATVIRACTNWAMAASKPMDGSSYVLTSSSPSDPAVRASRPSQDSGHGVSPSSGTPSFHYASRDDVVMDDEVDELEKQFEDSEDDFDAESSTFRKPFESRMQDRLISRVMQKHGWMRLTVSKLGFAADVVFTLLNRPLFILAFFYVLLGVATLFRLGMANRVFSLLAHFIKGGIFFLYGVVTLIRYFGAFKDHGMAWNVRPSLSHKKHNSRRTKYADEYEGLPPNPLYKALSWIGRKMPSMEFVECSLIFTYGSSNIFLEHLANAGGAWSHMDLQHASIAFMYIGGGLAGLIIESYRSRKTVSAEDPNGRNAISFNPFPAFIVFWTGALMSKHEQALKLSSEIHTQWGVLLSVGALVRLLTYVILYLGAPKSTEPSRPFTELIVAFCLICGGMVFMQSNAETVEAMIYRGLDSMFTLNVNVGVSALIMSWIMCVMVVRRWASR